MGRDLLARCRRSSAVSSAAQTTISATTKFRRHCETSDSTWARSSEAKGSAYEEEYLPRGRASWGAIVAGVVAAFVRAVFEVNVFHRVTSALVDLIVASRGRIVTISSLSGTLSSTILGAYSMSKHAIEAYTDALAKQLAPLGVRVCAVVPGNYESGIVRNAVERFAPPADASEDVRAFFVPDADTSRSEFPGPEPVAAACHATLFDEAPLERYLVVPNAEEADRTLEQAAHEWARLNASTPHAWTTARLVAAVEAGVDAASRTTA